MTNSFLRVATTALFLVICDRASAASIATCRVYDQASGSTYASQTGVLGCNATGPLLTSATIGFVNIASPLTYNAYAGADGARQEWSDPYPYVESQFVLDTREDFYFADVPAGALLRYEFYRSTIGLDWYHTSLTIAGYQVTDLNIRHTLDFPILGSQPITIETLFELGCVTSGLDSLKCSSGLGLQLHSLSVVDSNGNPVTGFRYGTSSNYGSYDLAGGTLDQSLPEPSTFLLTGAALATIAARLRRSNRPS